MKNPDVGKKAVILAFSGISRRAGSTGLRRRAGYDCHLMQMNADFGLYPLLYMPG
jgi:hypothetical protein